MIAQDDSFHEAFAFPHLEDVAEHDAERQRIYIDKFSKTNVEKIWKYQLVIFAHIQLPCSTQVIWLFLLATCWSYLDQEQLAVA